VNTGRQPWYGQRTRDSRVYQPDSGEIPRNFRQSRYSRGACLQLGSLPPQPEPATVAWMKCLAGIAAVLWMSAAHSQTPAPDPAAPAASQPQIAAPAEADVAVAIGYIKGAWNDFTHCRRASACNTYFETFGVAISFANGSFVPFSHVQRLTATSHDCIKTAKALREQGDKSLAVQWVMASRIENTRVRDWLGNHPDAILEALHHCCW
jgi:hypothetical protein